MPPQVPGPDLIPYPKTHSFKKFKDQFLKSNAASSTTKITFIGTVKIHGANVSIVFKNSNKEASSAQFQSRNCALSRNRDHQGAMKALSAAPLHLLVDEILRVRGQGGSFKEIMIAGEWAGRGIQKHPPVGISDVPLLFAIFNIRVDNLWVGDMRQYSTVALPEHRIYNVTAVCPTYEINIDMTDDTSIAEATMEELTTTVANRCPFAAPFLKLLAGQPRSVRGEGIVWVRLMEHESNQLSMFKTRDLPFCESGASNRSRAPPPTNAHEAAIAFTEYACTDRRLDRGIEYLKEIGCDLLKLDKENQEEYVNWICHDTMKEEGHEMMKFGAKEEVVKKVLRERASRWLNKRCGADFETASFAPDDAHSPQVAPASSTDVPFSLPPPQSSADAYTSSPAGGESARKRRRANRKSRKRTARDDEDLDQDEPQRKKPAISTNSIGQIL